MDKISVIESLKSAFNMEVSNVCKSAKDELIIVLADNTKAKITIKNIA